MGRLRAAYHFVAAASAATESVCVCVSVSNSAVVVAAREQKKCAKSRGLLGDFFTQSVRADAAHSPCWRGPPSAGRNTTASTTAAQDHRAEPKFDESYFCHTSSPPANLTGAAILFAVRPAELNHSSIANNDDDMTITYCNQKFVQFLLLLAHNIMLPVNFLSQVSHCCQSARIDSIQRDDRVSCSEKEIR